ncbi:MAG TPA: helix-turn-helix domain-containing GNAT family N-acetyltransferase [Actinophytocola sp.]|uniref:bifunctional helix-turn-helix transcriptional regulator/GNAT family N-acetyltransferase n=1 Tax=Actinophytocola sp. TaxID=1872138 RepID=UPI002DDD71EE|nr:helix-turn-helix domain-containing GNAT family N-acetyltransferase [Actinophytocola sp.]HEV2779044.1 helix-turn-helix domain-containing GNAT family N-acetyltransferase [Actinophytocola sp.]
MNATVPAERIQAVREFNRMYTKIIGLLDESMLSTPYSLTEARVLFELSRHPKLEVSVLRKTLGLDPGYLSRLLARFETDGLVERERSTRDGRVQVIRLTATGKEVFQLLDGRSSDQVRALLAGITDEGQRRLVQAMDVITQHLGTERRRETVVLRPPRPGDFGWIVQRHGTLYAEEYGWDSSFEGMTARIVGDYLAEHDPRREAAWIAEVHGEPAGSVFCMRKDDATARLRLLLVEPSARGLGVGTRLVRECLAFARGAGYRAMELWTVDVLAAARRIYQREGFQLVSEDRRRRFGHDLNGQTWRLEL